MNRIDQRFETLRARGECAFIPYIAAGDPTLEHTIQMIVSLEKAGADVIELGVPFSDPLADGVVNQEAALRALKSHVTLHDVVAMVKEARARTEVPLLLFTYFNPVLAYGVEAFARDAKEAGVDGVLCVDLPPEEAEDYVAHMRRAGLATVFLIAPTSTPGRIERIAQVSTGFIYYVSRTGVTGTRDNLEATVHGVVDEIRKHTGKPIAVGFGISTPEQASEVAGFADGVIVGSAIVRMMGEEGGGPEAAERVAAFAKTLSDAAKSVRTAAS